MGKTRETDKEAINDESPNFLRCDQDHLIPHRISIFDRKDNFAAYKTVYQGLNTDKCTYSGPFWNRRLNTSEGFNQCVENLQFSYLACVSNAMTGKARYIPSNEEKRVKKMQENILRISK